MTGLFAENFLYAIPRPPVESNSRPGGVALPLAQWSTHDVSDYAATTLVRGGQGVHATTAAGVLEEAGADGQKVEDLGVAAIINQAGFGFPEAALAVLSAAFGILSGGGSSRAGQQNGGKRAWEWSTAL